MAGRWGRRRWIAVTAGLVALALTPVMAGAAPLGPSQIYKPIGFFRFCPEAQVDIANIDEAVMASKGITIGGTIYDDYVSDFQFSKSSVDITGNRILTAEWIQYKDPAKTQPRTIRCKMRTGESIDKGAWPPGSSNNGGRFAVDPYFGFGPSATGVSTSPTDQSCSVVNQRTIDNVWANLSPAEKSASQYNPTNGTLVTTPDVVTGDGPTWLGDTPPLQVNGAVLEAQSRSLLAPVGAGDARLSGAHYCTFVPPQYLRDVLLGVATVS